MSDIKLPTVNKLSKNPLITPEAIKLLNYRIEQVEEHDKMQTWVDKLNAFGEDKIALRLLDNEMSN